MKDIEIKLQYLIDCYGVEDLSAVIRVTQERLNDWTHTKNMNLFKTMARKRISNEFARVVAEDKVFELRSQDGIN